MNIYHDEQFQWQPHFFNLLLNLSNDFVFLPEKIDVTYLFIISTTYYCLILLS